ncbi:MAG: hypothetical protein ACOC32_04915 [Nanoarchaeota archaeon]
MKSSRFSSKRDESSRVEEQSVLDNVIFRSILSFLFLCLLLPFGYLLLLSPPLLDDVLTGDAVTMMSILNADPVINITNGTYFTETMINISVCGYDPNLDPINCTFSAPFGHENGTWIANETQSGEYEIQINATDGIGGFSTKNVTFLVIPRKVFGECNMRFDILGDHNINISWDPELRQNSFNTVEYSNFTISYVDRYYNGTFNKSDAINVTDITTPHYHDTWANMTESRLYKLYGFNGPQVFECNQTYGKITHTLTPDYGRWNYVSIPFSLQNRSIKHVFRSAWDELENLFVYNHETGSFNFFIFSVDFGDFSRIDDGVCLLVQPLNPEPTRVTFTGELLRDIGQNLSMNYGRWNYQGWVAQDTRRQEAFSGYEFDLENLFKYDHSTGSFEFFIFSISPPTGFGEIDEIPAGTCNVIQPLYPVNYNYTTTSGP